MALRRGLLPAWRNREPDQGVARHEDRPHQLQPLLGQPVPRAVDRSSLCADAGAAPKRCWHQLRKGASLDAAGALPETGCANDGLGTAHGCAPAAIVPVSGDLPAYGTGTGSFAWVGRTRTHETPPSLSNKADDRGKPRPKTVVALRTPSDNACRHLHHANFTLPSSSSAI